MNFGIVYGLSPFGLSQQLGIDTKEAKRFIDAYFEKYSGRARVHRPARWTRRGASRQVKTLFGRVRPIPDIHSKNFNLRGFAERTAVNTPLQGTAADLIKLAMIRIDRDLRHAGCVRGCCCRCTTNWSSRLRADEVETLRELVQREMEQVYALRVPLVVDIGVGPNWRDME